ncbi:MAG: HD domain-containing protein [Treponema sp.]
MIQKIDNLTSKEQFFSRYPCYTENAEDMHRIGTAWDILLTERIPASGSGTAAGDVSVSAAPAGNSRAAGELPHDAAHSLRMAYILADLEMDAGSIICAILYSENGSFSLPDHELEKNFGTAVKNILDAASKFSDVKLYNKNKEHSDTVCRMFFSMVDDLRVMIVQLADRLDKIRYISAYPAERQRRIAGEIIEIWAPLAQRMGISRVQNELEDLSLKYINREVFDQIKEVVSAKKKERETFLQAAEKEISAKLAAEGITVTVQSRAKHFWSIYQKMKKRNKAADELYDLQAMRILCSTVNECYTILGVVHTIWKPLDGRFKDYISMSKANGYQSLHTTVICPEGQTLEIQIRTYEMHEVAERGVASHWVYKKRDSHTQVAQSELSFVQQVKSLTRQKSNTEEFLSTLKRDFLKDSIYVFTPKGDIIELPAGATAIDFAYSIHSAVGEKIVAAKSNGSIIPLSKSLNNAQVVEIITHPNAHPTHNHYEYAKTARARQKIRGWMQLHDMLQPTEKLEKEDKLRRTTRTLTPPKPKEQHESGKETDEFSKDQQDASRQPPPAKDSATLHIRAGDGSNFLIKFAHCCNPKPGDAICGYVSRGRGIIIHKQLCSNLKNIPDIADRLINVEWVPDKKPKTS